jgi:(p)ppGpp synthase/HD superfamily hydrolase
MAALLHDVLDDTPVSYADLEATFGPRVAGMVAQVSKLSAVNQMLRRDKRRGVLSPDPVYWYVAWAWAGVPSGRA